MSGVPIGRRNLFSDRRAALGIIGVGVALLLVLMLAAIVNGAMRQVTRDTSAADVFVAQRGVTNMHMASSAVPLADPARIRALPGVAWADPTCTSPMRWPRQRAPGRLRGGGTSPGGRMARPGSCRDANEPAVILADEPTANLDSKIGHEIARLRRRITLNEQRSVVIVSHDARLKEIADRVLWLEDGQFRSLSEMATDPVCGMAVEREGTPHYRHDGQTYYFCSPPVATSSPPHPATSCSSRPGPRWPGRRPNSSRRSPGTQTRASWPDRSRHVLGAAVSDRRGAVAIVSGRSFIPYSPRR
jgi:YHS domain-containing protein